MNAPMASTSNFVRITRLLHLCPSQISYFGPRLLRPAEKHMVGVIRHKSKHPEASQETEIAYADEKRKEIEIPKPIKDFLKGQEKTTVVKRSSFFRGNVEQKIDKVDIFAFRKAFRENRTKEGFITVIHDFIMRDRLLRGHLSFIYTALEYIDAFGLEKDLNVYNELLEVLPKYKIVNRTLFDALWPKPYPQIDAGLDLLTKMEDNGVRPDDLTYTILLEVFGRASLPVQKAQRMAYWFDKYWNANPYLLSEEDLKDRFKLCEMALKRMMIDEESIKIYTAEESKDLVGEKSFLIGSQNNEQRDFIAKHDTGKTLYIEGPYNIWMNHIKEQYYLLRSEALFIENPVSHEDDTRVREGMVLGVCMTNQPIKDALSSWLKYLQKDNPRLSEFKIIFNVEIPSEIMSRP